VVGRLLFAAVAATLVDCSFDPVHDEAIADLGPEAPGVDRGPLHRAGQPCLVCHDGSTASPAMSAGGTVYRVLGDATPLGGASVALSDARGTTFTAATNAAGNFYVTPSTWQPVYPVRVAVTFGGKTATMTTIVGRDGSCASCHADPKSRISAGPVYLVPVASLFPSGAGP
jgi:hypothetical protein